jgi:hypothetical protein
MAKRNTKTPVVIKRDKFIMPKMEWFELDEAMGEGFYLKELAGDAILTFKEDFERLEKTGEIQFKDALDMMAKYIVLSACDAHGNCLFTDEDFSFIRAKNPNLLVNIANVAMPLSGMQLTGLDVEVAVNLKNDQPSSSTTDLPTNSENQ